MTDEILIGESAFGVLGSGLDWQGLYNRNGRVLHRSIFGGKLMWTNPMNFIAQRPAFIQLRLITSKALKFDK